MTRNGAGLDEIPPLTIEDGLNRNLVYQAIINTIDSLRITPVERMNLCSSRLLTDQL